MGSSLLTVVRQVGDFGMNKDKGPFPWREVVSAVALIAFVILWFGIWSQRGVVYEGYRGEVNVYPEGAQAKSYRLKATIDTTVEGSTIITNRFEYVVTEVQWPDGKRSQIDWPCVLPETGRVSCSTGDGDDYEFELAEKPSLASSDNGGTSY